MLIITLTTKPGVCDDGVLVNRPLLFLSEVLECVFYQYFVKQRIEQQKEINTVNTKFYTRS